MTAAGEITSYTYNPASELPGPRLRACLALALLLPGVVRPVGAQHAMLSWRVGYSDLAMQAEDQAHGTPVAVIAADEGIVLVEWVPATEPTHPTDSSISMLARDTGRLLWRRRLPDCHVFEPMVAGNLLVVRSSVGLSAIELEDGAIRWQHDLPIEFPFSFLAQTDLIIASGNDAAGQPAVVCLDLHNGALRWQWRPPPIEEIPGLYLVSAASIDQALGVAWLGLYDGSLRALALDSGAVTQQNAFPRRLQGLLSPRDGLLIAFDGTLATALAVPELRTLWTAPALWPEDRLLGRLSPLNMPVVWHQRQLHVASRAAQRLTSFDLETGELLWDDPVECDNPGYQLLATKSHSILVSTDRITHLTQLDWFESQTGRWIANLEVPRLSYPSHRSATSDSEAVYAATWQYIAKVIVVQ